MSTASACPQGPQAVDDGDLKLSTAGTEYKDGKAILADTFSYVFHVIIMTIAERRWTIVMSQNAGFTDQVCVFFVLSDRCTLLNYWFQIIEQREICASNFFR